MTKGFIPSWLVASSFSKASQGDKIKKNNKNHINFDIKKASVLAPMLLL
jgi:hypothetical protein